MMQWAPQIGLAMFVAMVVLMALRIPIAAAMFIPGLLGYGLMSDSATALNFLKGSAVARLTVYELSVIPLFLLMGQFATQGGLSRDLFKAAAALVGHVRGGLAMASVLSAGAFGAVCGSSVATSATITQVAYPEMRRHGYQGRLSTASLAAGGTLGILIPPSVPLVVYAILTEQNIAKLFAFSPTEGAGVGAVLTLLVGLAKKELKSAGMKVALLSTAETTAMVFMIFLGADMMNATLALTEMPKMVAMWVSGLPVAPLGIVMAVLVLYIVLGCVMDELSMLLLTIPVIFPAVMALDLWSLSYELKALWFGILVLMTVSFGLIAPPVGLNVYVVNSLARDVPMRETYQGLIPFLAWDLSRMVVLLMVPSLSLWLVGQLFTR